MDMPIDANTRFAIGQPVSRKEDPVLLRGEGRYSDDLSLPGQAYAPWCAAVTPTACCAASTRPRRWRMPGVLGIYTAADLAAAGIGAMQATVGKHRDGSATPKPHQMPLAPGPGAVRRRPGGAGGGGNAGAGAGRRRGRVPRRRAPARRDRRARGGRTGRTVMHDEAPGNVVLDFHFGDAAAVAAAFAGAAHVTRLDLRNSRIVVAAMEPRSALAAVEDGRLVLRVGCQGVFGLRNTVASVMNVPADAGARADRQRRRLVRHEGGRLPGIHRACCTPPARWAAR